MKTIVKILTGLVAFASIVSCSMKAEFNAVSFVSANKTSVNVNEDASASVGVTVYPVNGKPNTEVSFEVIEGTGKAGVDFTVEPANGLLSFTEDSTAYITIKPIAKVGEYTGNKDFSIKLTDASNGYNLGAFNTVNVVIADLDHPLSAILGQYQVNGFMAYDNFYYSNNTMELKPVEGNTNQVTCTAITAFAIEAAAYGVTGSFDVIGTVSDDMKTITFKSQKVAAYATEGDPFIMYSTDYYNDAGEPGWYTFKEDIVFTATETGFQSTQGIGFFDSTEDLYPYSFGVGSRTNSGWGNTWTRVE